MTLMNPFTVLAPVSESESNVLTQNHNQKPRFKQAVVFMWRDYVFMDARYCA